MPNLRHSASLPTCDALIVIAVDSHLKAPGLAARHSADILSAAEQLAAAFSADEVVTVPAPAELNAARVLVVSAKKLDGDHVRRAVGAAVRAVKRAAHVAVLSPSAELAGAVTEGALLGAYCFTSYLSPDPKKIPVDQITVVAPKSVAGDVTRAQTIAEAVNATRDLVNLPANDLGPADLADHAKSVAKSLPIKVTVLDEKGLTAAGYAGHLAVGTGSARGPRLVTLEYSPRGALTHIALVGKGIIFDSGGLSLKPPKSMERMKDDMAGAATVLQTIVAAAQLGLKVKITAVMCLAENLPSATSQRPGDIIRYADGTTVEVLNTDAEGRLVLADGLIAAQETGADTIIDVATLTGAAVVALGPHIAGVMGTDDVRTRIVDAADAAGEEAWPMPLPANLKSKIESPYADLANVGGPHGGMLTAGLFLQEFVKDVPWAHIDIAGPAFNEGSAFGYIPKGGTGYGVRLLLEFLQRSAPQSR